MIVSRRGIKTRERSVGGIIGVMHPPGKSCRKYGVLSGTVIEENVLNKSKKYGKVQREENAGVCLW
jgi:hypothetical protein